MENKRLWPCVKCAERTFKYRIAPKLKEWGYILPQTNKKFNDLDIIITNCILRGNCVDIRNIEDVKKHDRYLCRSVSEFLEAAKALAIHKGWHKETVVNQEEMKWEKECPISKLPKRLRRLAEFRRDENSDNLLLSIIWDRTAEGFYFWKNVHNGIVPDNLEEVLKAFEREHPDESDFPMMPQSRTEVLSDPVRSRVNLDPLLDKFTKFQEVATPLIKFLNEYYHMNCKAIVTTDGAEIVEDILGFTDNSNID